MAPTFPDLRVGLIPHEVTDTLTDTHIPHEVTDSYIPDEVTDSHLPHQVTDSLPLDLDFIWWHIIKVGSHKKHRHHHKGQHKKHHGHKKGVQTRGWPTWKASGGWDGDAAKLLDGHPDVERALKGLAIAGMVILGLVVVVLVVAVVAWICREIGRALQGARQEGPPSQAPVTSTAGTSNPQPPSSSDDSFHTALEAQPVADLPARPTSPVAHVHQGSPRWWNRLAAVTKRPRTRKEFESFHMFDVLTISNRTDKLEPDRRA